MDLLKKVIDENRHITSVILSRRGEPLMHPRIVDMVCFLRERNVYVSMYTNGILLDDDLIDKLLNSTVNELIFSMDGTGDFYEHVRGVEYEKCRTVLLKTIRKRNEYGFDTKIAINTVRFDDGSNVDPVLREWGDVVDYIIVQPWMIPGIIPRRTPCRSLWRTLVISWNGDVVACCQDQENEFFLGNVSDHSISELFNGPVARNLRERHLSKNYPELCTCCHPHLGFRVFSKK
jgi:radical SAM protein with 4Fe4S-binding SPASM domain